MDERLKTNFAGLDFKNPLVLASGTCGFGDIMDAYFDIERLGGISTKGLTLKGSKGNPGMRIWETPSGIMNSVGLENPGIKGFIDKYLEFLQGKDLVNIVNLSGHSQEDFVKGLDLLNQEDIDIIELNISCPNLKEGGMSFGVKTEVARKLVRKLRANTDHKLVIKLSPNAEDIMEISKMCEEEGADGLSLVNTFLAMAVDIKEKKPIFENTYAGLSGPAIKPIALRMVHQVAQNVSIPIMAMGGITTWQDALEYIMVGSTVVQIGTANFIKPDIAMDILEGLEAYLVQEDKTIDDLRGII